MKKFRIIFVFLALMPVLILGYSFTRYSNDNVEEDAVDKSAGRVSCVINAEVNLAQNKRFSDFIRARLASDKLLPDYPTTFDRELMVILKRSEEEDATLKVIIKDRCGIVEER